MHKEQNPVNVPRGDFPSAVPMMMMLTTNLKTRDYILNIDKLQTNKIRRTMLKWTEKNIMSETQRIQTMKYRTQTK